MAVTTGAARPSTGCFVAVRVGGSMGGGVGCRCCVCSTTAGSATLARAWLATVLLVGAVVASGGCHSRHDWALSRSGLAGFARARLLASVVGFTGAASVSMPCGQGLVRPRLRGVGAAGSGVGVGKEALVDCGMGRGCGCRRCWACRTMAWSDSLARAWLATELLMGLVEACCGRHSSRLGSERVGLGRVCPGLLACMCCRVGGDHGVAGKLWGRLPLVSVGLCRVGRGRTASTARYGCAGSGCGGPGRRDERCCSMCGVLDVKSVLVSSAITANKFLRVDTRRGLSVDKMA